MSAEMDPDLLAEKQLIVDDIQNYMQFGAADDENDEDYDANFESGYEQTHVDRRSVILTDYLDSIAEQLEAPPETLLEVVKSTVEELNTLNDDSDGTIIETDQRERICEFIENGLRFAGFEPDFDPTEQWREW